MRPCKIHPLRVGFLFLLILASQAAQSQCGCKFTIAPGASITYFNGIASGVQPGDVICIQAGSKGGIQFTDVKGSATNPVIIKNCGGQALIGGPTINNALLFIGSQYIRITGTGDPAVEYGLKIVGTASGSQGLAAVALSSDFEIDHMEIQNAGYNGMMIKSDPSTTCSNKATERPNFTMRNIKVHDNYVHDTGGEGIYLGVSFYNGTTLYCGSMQYNHEVRGVRIYNNRFENNGREGIQVGSGVDDVAVYDNRVINYGTTNIPAQNGGIQLGLGTAGRLYNNFVKGGTGPAIAIQGIGNDYVYNNIVVNPGEQAITLNTRPTPLATDIVNQGFLGGVYIINNTFVNVGPKGVVEEFINNAPGNRMFNNLIVGSSNPWDKTYTYTDWQKGNNVFIPLIANAKFVNPALDDYRLIAGSPAINAGRDVSSFGVTFDFVNTPRPSGGAWDVGAFELAGNQKPIVTVGANQTLTLPTDATTVSGSAVDPDGSIAGYLWTKLSGPAAVLTNQTTTTLSLSSLVAGVYLFRLTATDNEGETGFADITVTVIDPSVNQPPVANAGGNKTLTLPTNTTVLNGSGSDPDGTIQSYLWEKMSGPAATLTNDNTATLTLTGLVQGVYVFRLTVTDDQGATATNNATVTVNPAAANQPPVASAGANVNLVLPTNSVNLSGSGSDPDGTIASYLWTKISGPAATLTNATTATLQLTGLVVGSYVFRLTVTDNLGATGFAEATVTVSAANVAPSANAGGNKTIQLPTNSTILNGSGSDPDGSITSYAWIKVSGPTATLANANTATLSVTNMVVGVYVFRLTVTDNQAATGSAEATVTVLAANNPPVANAGPNITITLPVNTTVLNGSGTDSDGTVTGYLWEKVSGPTATLAGTTTAILSLSNLVVGSYVFRLTVTDNNGATGIAQATITVLPLATNQSPLVSAGLNFGITLPTNSTTITGTASDPDGSIASLSWTKVSGPTATLGGTTTLNLAASDLVAGVYVFRLTATDNLGASASAEMTLTVSNSNQPPLVTASSNVTLTLPANSTVLNATASDPDGTIALYLWSNLSGPSSPTLSGITTNSLTVSNLVAGTYVFRITVTDNQGATAFAQVNVIVQTATNINPVANAGPPITLFLPTNFVVISGSGSDADGTISAYSWTQISGSAASLANSNTSTLTVTGLSEGVYIFRLTVTDNAGGTGISDVTVTVNAASANQPPIANAGPNIALTLPTNSTNLIGSGADPDGTIASYNWIKVSGPTATLSNENTAVLSLQNLQAGVYIFRLTVTDNNTATASAQTQVTVFPATVNQAPLVTLLPTFTVTLPTNTATLNAVASDPDGSIATYSWTKQIGPTATLGGQASTNLVLTDLLVGTYVFRITVTDNQGATAFAETTLTVLPAGSNNPPVVNAGLDKTLFLPTNSVNLPGTASDTDGSITSVEWIKLSGPTATLTNQTTLTLSLSNLVAGQYTFKLTATDNQGATGSSTVHVTVFPGNVNQAPIANAGANQTIVLPTTTTSLSGSGFDPDGSIASYSWTQVSGPATSLSNINSPTLFVSGLAAGVFQFQLTVTDNLGASGSSVAQVTVVPNGANQPPIANAGFDRVITLPVNSLEIQGSGTDPDGSIAAYNWVKKSGPLAGTLAGQTTSKLTLSALVAGTYVFTLTVTDNQSLTNSDDVQVTVLPSSVNTNPVVNAGVDVIVRLPATSTALTAIATDADGSIATYLWTKVSGPAATLGATNTTALALTNLVLGTYVFRIEVADNLGATATDEVTVTVLPPGVNQPPVVLAGAPKIISLPLNTTTLNGSASDPDGTIKTLLWTAQSGPSTPDLSGTATTTLLVQNLVAGTYTFRLTATDNENASAFSETTVEVKASHAPPQAFAGNDTTLFLPNNFLSLTGNGLPSEGVIVNYEWIQTDGPNTTLLGAYPNISLVDLLPGIYVFRLTVTDNFGATGSDDRVVRVVEGKSNPIGAQVFFSPNGDTFNDLWTIKNTNMITGCPVKIFNSLGKVVFEADEYLNDWNGTYNGQTAKEGDYYFVFECSGKKTYSGALRLIR
ncbi:MAG: tandem-95 repeat protein [Cyclobacteriaceae bacterium]|nr:tandem-95 repeat protein [Cyclobacteriaceae bacterium]